MGVAVHIAELRRDARIGRRGEIEDEGASRAETVGEELPVGGQFVLGVVRAVPEPRHGDRRHERAVTLRLLRDIEDREEVRLRGVGRGGPQVEVLLRRAGIPLAGRAARDECTQHRGTEQGEELCRHLHG